MDRKAALFGDHPPPPRSASPYPSGKLIYQYNKRVVVQHKVDGIDAVTKYTTGTDGFISFSDREPNEARALKFVREHTTIPVPVVLSSDWDRVTMTYIPGRTLQQAWPVLTEGQKDTVLAELRGYIQQLRGISAAGEASGKKPIGRLDGCGAVVPSVVTRCSGHPFTSVSDFHQWLVRPPKRLHEQTIYWSQITAHLASEDNQNTPIVFTHADLAARNIIIDDNGHIAAILDWEFAGWYPAYWEYVFAMRGLDRVDWQTLEVGFRQYLSIASIWSIF